MQEELQMYICFFSKKVRKGITVQKVINDVVSVTGEEEKKPQANGMTL
jgi:hypothetical protein